MNLVHQAPILEIPENPLSDPLRNDVAETKSQLVGSDADQDDISYDIDEEMSRGSKSDRGGNRNRLFSGSDLTPFLKSKEEIEQEQSEEEDSESYEMNSQSISDGGEI